MVRKQYGTTWWGKKWLDSLTGIDHANRIPRGLSYARNGRVLDVELNPHLGKIQATVSGSHYSSYTIKLSFKRVPDNKKNNTWVSLKEQKHLETKVRIKD